ncbi:cation transporter [uncultured Acetobacteroides sp.]|uniref:heavy-metal-associated domain-containing protein n=1 Tax=uncultured Acetobacteroides sp. TaxID=1760811 RepID=UPI0029F5B090|nr:cation transporter [uncultured Acetobacteroides sp.]
MKTVKIVLAAIIVAALSITSYAQKHDHSKMVATKTATIKVWGSCELCKARIEKAAKIEGVSKADWNVDTKKLTLVYNPSKVTSDEVQKRIAAVGHDTEKYKANDKAYRSLPSCCRYVRKK